MNIAISDWECTNDVFLLILRHNLCQILSFKIKPFNFLFSNDLHMGVCFGGFLESGIS